MRRELNAKEYEYKGYYIYKITNRDFCVYSDGKCIIDATTLAAAKKEIDKIK